MSDPNHPRPSQLRRSLAAPGSSADGPHTAAPAPLPLPSPAPVPPAAPHGPDRQRRSVGKWVAIAATVVIAAAVGIGVAVGRAPVPDKLALTTDTSVPGTAAPATTGPVTSLAPATTARPVTTPAPTTAKATVPVRPATTAAPVATVPRTTAPPATTAPVSANSTPTHEAVYRGGKLYLTGRLPNRNYADAFVKKASEVIGAQNVVNQYVIDPTAPTPTAGNVRVDEQFLFQPGSATLSADYTQILDLGVAVMRLNPKVTMTIVGHTDDVGDPESNQALSVERAQAVVNYISSKGIAPARFSAFGRGETQPRVPNDSPEHRALNRRIEVQLDNLLA